MRIISYFHDYYDVAMRQGVDPSRVWLRQQEILSTREELEKWGIEEWPFPESPDVFEDEELGVVRSQWMIGFCGKIYPVLRYTIGAPGPKSDHSGSVSSSTLLWSLKDVDQYYRWLSGEEHRGGQAGQARPKVPFTWLDYVGKRKAWSRQRIYADYFESVAANQARFEPLFLSLNTPVFVAYCGTGIDLLATKVADWRSGFGQPGGLHGGTRFARILVRNARLKDLDFVTRFDPYQAFQEIEMFFGNVLLGSDGHKAKYKGQLLEPTLDDVTKAESKGFDRWSFRKEPSKKRNKKK